LTGQPNPTHLPPPLQRVVIMGTGSFALEAMEAAGRSGAEHITLVSRPRQRWVYRPVLLLVPRLPPAACRLLPAACSLPLLIAVCPVLALRCPLLLAASPACRLSLSRATNPLETVRLPLPWLPALPAPPTACRWVLPFSRQFTISVWNFMPLVPWPIKIKLVMVGGHTLRTLRTLW
jgi:hypothetical protein